MICSLVIPCYNEAQSLPLLLESCKNLVKNKDIEVILVDNGSTDSTAQVLSSLVPLYPGIKSIRLNQNLGYGNGINAGLKKATGKILAWTHADLQTHPDDILLGLEIFKLYGSNLFVKGRRYGRSITDVFFTFGMTVLELILLRRWMLDINAQPTMFSREFYLTWVSPPNDFSLDLYAFFQAKSSGIKIHRFPVLFSNRVHGISHWNFSFASKWRFICRTLSYSYQLKRKVLG